MAGYHVALVCLKKNDGEELTNLPRSIRAGRAPGKYCLLQFVNARVGEAKHTLDFWQEVATVPAG